MQALEVLDSMVLPGTADLDVRDKEKVGRQPSAGDRSGVQRSSQQLKLPLAEALAPGGEGWEGLWRLCLLVRQRQALDGAVAGGRWQRSATAQALAAAGGLGSRRDGRRRCRSRACALHPPAAHGSATLRGLVSSHAWRWQPASPAAHLAQRSPVTAARRRPPHPRRWPSG
jgi:hypothetical protein